MLEKHEKPCGEISSPFRFCLLGLGVVLLRIGGFVVFAFVLFACVFRATHNDVRNRTKAIGTCLPSNIEMASK